jgi:superfamily I DNA and/or RNA helicase
MAERTFFEETQQPIERDDRESRELLRLSQLEGRDPLQDAVAGRLALDRLDALAEGDDSVRASWADELRRELRERFNDIAPTKWDLVSK